MVFAPIMDLDDLLAHAETTHGHLCAGQILGVRMAMLALDRLGIADPRSRLGPDGALNPDRKRLVTFVEIDRCATDAIAVVTGCRVGKRALKLRDWGKMAATFVDLNAKLDHPAGSSAADSGAPGSSPATHAYKGLRLAALESSKDHARALYPGLEKNAQQMRAYRELRDADLFGEQWVRVDLPPSEFPGFRGERVACAVCGEGINFDRWIERGIERLCLGCADPERRYYHPL